MVLSHIVRTAVIKFAAGYSWPVLHWWFTFGNWIATCTFAHFSTSHTHLDVVPSDKHISWVNYAVDHTVDIDPSKSTVNWLMGYLNCQVIHHLFPDMPQFRQPEVSDDRSPLPKSGTSGQGALVLRRGRPPSRTSTRSGSTITSTVRRTPTENETRWRRAEDAGWEPKRFFYPIAARARMRFRISPRTHEPNARL